MESILMLYPGRRQHGIERLFEIPPVSLEMSPTGTETLPEQTTIVQARHYRHVPQYGNRYYNQRPHVPAVLEKTDHHLPNLTTTIKKNSVGHRLLSFIGEAIVLWLSYARLCFLDSYSWDIFTFVGEQLFEPIFVCCRTIT